MALRESRQAEPRLARAGHREQRAQAWGVGVGGELKASAMQWGGVGPSPLGSRSGAHRWPRIEASPGLRVGRGRRHRPPPPQRPGLSPPLPPEYPLARGPPRSEMGEASGRAGPNPSPSPDELGSRSPLATSFSAQGPRCSPRGAGVGEAHPSLAPSSPGPPSPPPPAGARLLTPFPRRGPGG